MVVYMRVKVEETDGGLIYIFIYINMNYIIKILIHGIGMLSKYLLINIYRCRRSSWRRR